MVEATLVVAGSVLLVAVAQRSLTSTSPLSAATARGAYAAYILQVPVLLTSAIAARPLSAAGDGKGTASRWSCRGGLVRVGLAPGGANKARPHPLIRPSISEPRCLAPGSASQPLRYASLPTSSPIGIRRAHSYGQRTTPGLNGGRPSGSGAARGDGGGSAAPSVDRAPSPLSAGNASGVLGLGQPRNADEQDQSAGAPDSSCTVASMSLPPTSVSSM